MLGAVRRQASTETFCYLAGYGYATTPMADSQLARVKGYI